MIKVGICGGIGGGKSTVCAMLAERGVAVYDSDSRAKALMCSLPDIKAQIIDRFGSDAPLREDFDNEDFFFVRTKAAISDGLISWIMQFEDNVEVVSPPGLREKLREKACRIASLCG